jgi:hypothetical protein
VSPSDIALAEADDERAPGWELVVGHGSPQELRSLVPDAELVGWANGDDRRAPLAIRRPAPAFEPAPPSFRVLAVVPAYDEVDILDHTIKHLVDNGVEVHVIDNWSTDGCFDIANGWLGNGVIKVDRFPDDGPADHFDWHEVLRRIPRIGAASGADWTLFNDADELRESPWPGVTLRDALWHVQCSGWNCVNLTLVNFALTNPETAAHGPSPDRSLTDSFPCLRPAPDADLTQLKLWRNTGEDVEIASTGGHTAKFTGRRVFPYNFLQRHYPYRSLEQAARKVQARERRRPKAERRMNWGWHYRTATLDSTLVPENGHIRFDDSFLENYLIERLSGIGWRTEIDPPTSLKHKVARGLDRVGLWKPYERARLWRRA